MADRSKRPAVSTERDRVMSRPVSRQKAEKLEEKRRTKAEKAARKAAEKAAKSPQEEETSAPVKSRPTVRKGGLLGGLRARTEADAASAGQEKPAGRRLNKAVWDLRLIKGGADRKKAGTIALISALVVVLAVIILVHSLAPAGLIELIETTAAGFGSGSGFPQEIGSTNNPHLSTVGGGSVAVLTDTGLLLYKNDGYNVFSRQHGFSDPVLSASTSRMLLYDRGGTRLRVENAARSLSEMTFEHPILTADLGYNGAFAVATRSSEHLCDVTLFGPDSQQLYVWHSATRYVSALSVSDDGRRFAVGLVSAEGGGMVSHVLLFDRGSTEPVWSQEYRGATVLSVDCKGGGQVVAVFDDRLSGIHPNGERTDYSFDGQTLQAFDNRPSAGVAVLLTKYNQPRSAGLMVFDNTLRQIGEGQAEGVVQDLSMDGGRVCVLMRDRLVVFDDRGQLVGRVDTPSDSQLVVNTGSRATVCGRSALYQFDIGHFAAEQSGDS